MQLTKSFCLLISVLIVLTTAPTCCVLTERQKWQRKVSRTQTRLDELTSRFVKVSRALDDITFREKTDLETVKDLGEQLNDLEGNGCREDQFRCAGSLQCVSQLLVCDGDRDCRNDADESFQQCGLTTADEDEVTDLPGLSYRPKFKHYSGYLRATRSKKLHYWFIESANDPANDPLVLWLNGGPGCSSLDGLLNEHGPFLMTNTSGTGHLVENPYSWNKVANMLYLESPAGVGFSYSDDKNYKTGDRQTAYDNHQALKDFFRKFPRLSKNELYITGESYAGMYVPILAVQVMNDPRFNLKGIAIGNGIHDYSLSFNARMYAGYYYGLIGEELWEKLMTYCCPDDRRKCNVDKARFKNPLCATQTTEFGQDILTKVNIYSLYSRCEGETSAFTEMSILLGTGYNYQNVLAVLAGANSHHKRDISPCLDTSVLKSYLNRQDVQQALHIPDKLPEWKLCNEKLFFSYNREFKNTTSQHKTLLAKNIRVLVYNGDWDLLCPFLGARWFVDGLEQPLREDHRTWYYTAEDGTKQVAGHVKTFKNLAFATIKGAGHPAPGDKPGQGLHMLSRFLKNEPL